MLTNDPWKPINSPLEETRISALRIPDIGSHTWGLYWAMDSQKHCLLILQYLSKHRHSQPLPKLRGLRVEILPMESQLGERLIIRLIDAELREVFHRFCEDIVDATRNSCSAADAVERFLSRTWRWYRLLKRGYNDRLSQEEQKGLIGEICVLERQLLPVIGPVDAVQAWTGPIGAPKDFQVGWVGIEAKTRSPLKSTVRISSTEQLDADETSRLFLSVIEVAVAPSDSGSVTITDVASRARNSIAATNSFAAQHFEERLSATGFDWDDDYSDSRFFIGDVVLFEVVEEFPRITPKILLPGIESVQYTIALSLCENFRVDMTELEQAISGVPDGH